MRYNHYLHIIIGGYLMVFRGYLWSLEVIINHYRSIFSQLWAHLRVYYWLLWELFMVIMGVIYACDGASHLFPTATSPKVGAPSGQYGHCVACF